MLHSHKKSTQQHKNANTWWNNESPKFPISCNKHTTSLWMQLWHIWIKISINQKLNNIISQEKFCRLIVTVPVFFSFFFYKILLPSPPTHPLLFFLIVVNTCLIRTWNQCFIGNLLLDNWTLSSQRCTKVPSIFDMMHQHRLWQCQISIQNSKRVQTSEIKTLKKNCLVCINCKLCIWQSSDQTT